MVLLFIESLKKEEGKKRANIAYLWVLEAHPIRPQIVNDAFTCIWKRYTTDEQDK